MSVPEPRQLLDFTGRVVLVTGGGRGLGAGIAARFAQAGASVAVNYHRSHAPAQSLVDQLIAAGGSAKAIQADVTRQAEAEMLVAETVAAFGHLDVLVNNTGIYPLSPLLEMSAEQWDQVMDTNLRSAFLCTQAAARQMIAQESGGAIVNIASIEAQNPAPGHSHYNAAKGGLLMHTASAANELGPHNIRVNAVLPGLIWRQGIETEWPDGVSRWHKAAPLTRLGLPDDIADACLFLASPAARWITGANLRVDGGVMTNQIF
ncbi:MAG: glucose 1-dehydrogenase [Anaerolineae bacterium]|nr:glucose 1-dehydrogenase [Anaerolineae bacterium]